MARHEQVVVLRLPFDLAKARAELAIAALDDLVEGPVTVAEGTIVGRTASRTTHLSVSVALRRRTEWSTNATVVAETSMSHLGDGRAARQHVREIVAGLKRAPDTVHSGPGGRTFGRTSARGRGRTAVAWVARIAPVLLAGLAIWGLVARLDGGGQSAQPTPSPAYSQLPRDTYAGITRAEAARLAAADFTSLLGDSVPSGATVATDNPRFEHARCLERHHFGPYWKVTFDRESPIFESKRDGLLFCDHDTSVTILDSAIEHRSAASTS